MGSYKNERLIRWYDDIPCPVCGVEGANLSDCRGKDAEDSTEAKELMTTLLLELANMA